MSTYRDMTQILTTAETVDLLLGLPGLPAYTSFTLGLSDNIVLRVIAIKFQYRNRDVSKSESCDASHVFGLQRWQKAISSFYLKMAIVLYEAILDSQRTMSDRKKRQLVYCKLFLIKQLL